MCFLCSERKMKPLLPRTDSYLVPIQLPVTPSVYLPSTSTPFPPPCSQQKGNNSRGTKRVRIAPKVMNFSYISAFLKCVVVLLHKLCKLQTAFQNKYFLELPRVYIDNIMCIEMSMNFTHTTKILMGMVACLTGDTKWFPSCDDISSEEYGL